MGHAAGSLRARPIGRLLLLACVCFAACAADDTWKNVERVVAVGDVHGDLPQLTAVLRSAGVIDGASNWTGGKTHLVQTGDLLDRGPDSRQLIALMMKLEKQARAAGGAVHCLIGNHEAMNLYGDLRYVSAADYAEYKTDQSEKLREKGYEEHLRQLRANPATAETTVDEAYRGKWDAAHPPGFFERQAYFAADGAYGKWIRGHNAIIRIDDMVFLHGGIGPKYVKTSLRKINEEISRELRDFSRLENGVSMDQEGPLWYRGLAQEDEKALAAHVKAVLDRQGAKSIIVGHTPTKGMVLPRFEGGVILIDVGLSAVFGSHMACLVVESGKRYAVHRGNRLPLPATPADLAAYLNRVGALEAAPAR